MKISKEKFIEVLKYLRKLESVNVDKLDLSEFNHKPCDDNGEDVTLEDWKFIGLNNKAWIHENLTQEELDDIKNNFSEVEV